MLSSSLDQTVDKDARDGRYIIIMVSVQRAEIEERLDDELLFTAVAAGGGGKLLLLCILFFFTYQSGRRAQFRRKLWNFSRNRADDGQTNSVNFD